MEHVEHVEEKGYAVQHAVGSGSYGSVYKVTDRQDKEFCIKAIALSRMTVEQKEKAGNEITIMELLNHPFIIQYIDYFTADEHLYVVMAYASKGDLSQEINRYRRSNLRAMDAEKICKYFTQICLAIKWLHEKRIIHRDLKSRNMFLMENDDVVLGDFGMSKQLSVTNAFCKTVVGTPHYASPEVAGHQIYSYASDMWSLGIVAYEMIALELPFRFQECDDRPVGDEFLRYRAPNFGRHALTADKSLRAMIFNLLRKEARQRPSIQKVLELPCCQKAIQKLVSLSPALAKVLERSTQKTLASYHFEPGRRPSTGQNTARIRPDIQSRCHEDEERARPI